MTEERGQIQEKEQEIDVLNLPPRKEVHGQQNSTTLKVSRPLLRFLFVVVLLLIILAGAFVAWGNEWLPLA